MKILAIDPGPRQTAILEWDGAVVSNAFILPNADVLENIDTHQADRLVCEMIASYGMSVGKEVFETCVWLGRYCHAWGGEWSLVTRNKVKNCLCHSSKAKDSNIRQAIIDRFPAIGGGKIPQIGTKKEPGPLFGMHDDLWAALAVALTYAEMGESCAYRMASDEVDDSTIPLPFE